MTEFARNKVAIVGYAQSAVQQHGARPLGALALDTARLAIADAGLRPDQIDGYASSAMMPSAGSHTAEDGVSTVSSGWLAERLGVNPRYAVGFQGNGQLPGSVSLAVKAIAAGAADYVLVHRALHNPKGQYHGNAMRVAPGPMQWTAPQGFFGPLAMIGLTYNEYLQRFNASRESMATVLVEARKNGARIPWSYWYGRPLTREKYLEAPLLADPICRLDCDIPVDGAAVFILTSGERAADLPHRPVYISGIAAGSPTKRRLPLHWPLDDLYDTGRETARRLWTASGLGPDQVDLPQLYDGFSPFIYLWLEVGNVLESFRIQLKSLPPWSYCCPVPRGNPSPKLAITVDPDVHERVVSAAAQEGVSLSAWMTEAARRALLVGDGLAAIAEWERLNGPFTHEEMMSARHRVADELGAPRKRSA